MTFWKRLVFTFGYVGWWAVLGVLMMFGMFQNPWLLLAGGIWFAVGLTYVLWDVFDR